MQKLILLPLILIALNVHSQQFKPVQINPFGINTSPYDYNDIQFADLTGDGAFDIIFNDAELEYGPFIIVNNGAEGAPDFSGIQYKDFLVFDENGYGQGSFTSITSRFYDIDQDGLPDHFFNLSSDDPTLPAEYFFEINIAPLTVPPDDVFVYFDETPGSDIGLPSIPLNTLETYCFGDLDNDGDDDILANRLNENSLEHSFVFYESLYSTGIQVFKNMGTENPYALPANGNGTTTFGFPGLLDMDNDGDLDLLLNLINGEWAYYENIGTPEQPEFTASVINPFGLTSLPSFGITHILDVNNDGKKDVIVGAGDSIYYFENDSPISNDSRIFMDNKISLNPNPANGFSSINTDDLFFNELLLIDINGATIQQIKTHNVTNYLLSTAGVQSGIYIVKIKLLDGTTLIKKLIKK